ncbi:MAG: MFS transporter, partial [Sphingobacteriales bacterium]
SKGYFGKRSDMAGKRVPYVQLGYTFSALSKPMMALFAYPVWIFFVRTIDRFGKGIRTGARDALLSDEATPATKAKVFGFHRSMDTVGAVLGPAAALLYLYLYPGDYKTLFLLAVIPGLLAILATFLLKEKQAAHKNKPESTPFFSFLGYWKSGSAAYRQLVTGLLLFAIINSSDVFILLKAKEAGVSDPMLIGLYIFYNLVYAIFAFPVGIVADNIGLKKTFVAGLSLFAIVYAGIALNTSFYGFGALFFIYGLYAAATEGISKAWISNISDKKETATAIGTYSAFQSICSMLASSLMGLAWYLLGSSTAFMLTAISCLMLIVYFTRLPALRNKPAME